MNQGFAERLKLLRKQKNLSQTQLGKLAELHYNHIGRYERGDSMPSAEALQRLAEVLGVSGDYLLSGQAEDAAKAKFEDYELLRMFQRTEKLGNDDKKVIKALLDAFLFKREVQGMVTV